MENIQMCESCGMAMRKREDFGMGYSENLYCKHCTDQNGKLKTYQKIFDGMKNFAIKNLGISEKEGALMAKEGMEKLPAWKNHLH